MENVELRPRRKRKQPPKRHNPGKGVWPNLLIQSPNLTVIDVKKILEDILK